MGLIYIRMTGSFPRAEQGRPHEKTCYAEEGGHANAIQKAIQHLNDQLPEAIALDHQLHDKGELPPKAPFGKG